MVIDAAQRCRWCGRRVGTGSAWWTRCRECGTVACSDCLDERRGAQAAWGEADATDHCPCGANDAEVLAEP